MELLLVFVRCQGCDEVWKLSLLERSVTKPFSFKIRLTIDESFDFNLVVLILQDESQSLRALR